MGILTGPGALTSCHARDSFPFYQLCRLYRHCCFHSHLVAIDFTPNTRLVLLKMCCYSIISQKDKLHSGILVLIL